MGQRQRDARAARIRIFIDHYRVTFNAKQAAIEAGYSPSNAADAGSDLLKDGRVQEMLQQAAAASMAAADVRVADILEALNELAYSDPNAHFDPQGRLLPIRMMPKAHRRAIAGYTVRHKRGDDETAWETVDVKLWPKNDALRTLAQHRGLLKTVVEHQITVTQLEKLDDVGLRDAISSELQKYERHLAARERLRGSLSELPAHDEDPNDDH